jgi:hypothetical protein
MIRVSCEGRKAKTARSTRLLILRLKSGDALASVQWEKGAGRFYSPRSRNVGPPLAGPGMAARDNPLAD